MHRFYIPQANISSEKAEISDPWQINHIVNALRLKIGDKVVLFDEQRYEYRAVIQNISGKNIIFKIKNKTRAMIANKLNITLACALPKKSKFDDIIDKLTQLGVNRIIPMLTERVIVKLDKAKEESRQKRWQKIALSASQQSQRSNLPIIDKVKSIHQVLSESKEFDLKLIPHLGDNRETLKDILSHNYKNIIILIGPEGDFTPFEVALAKKAGFIPITLGSNVLRVETAAVAITSILTLGALEY
jgi:16S rRNA (uracil1498-N3)-methyltransferase